MDAQERKRGRDDGVVDGGKRRDVGSVTASVTEVEDGEVEEFFAILRRIHVAASYFKRTGRDLTAEARRSLVALDTDGVDGVDGVKEEGKIGVEGSAESHAGLDLNLDPPLSDHNLM